MISTIGSLVYLTSRGDSVRRAMLLMVPALTMAMGCSTDSSVAPHAIQTTVASTPERNYSFSILPGSRTVRVRFARVRTEGGESVSAFMERMFTTADAAGATRLVLDLSATKGGDSFLVVPLVRGIVAREQFRKHGGLVVIVGPDTFSPSQSTAAALQRYAQPIFVDHPVT
jgi:hypothetical protein